MKKSVVGPYYTFECDKCKIGMEQWLIGPISKEWIWKCPKCGETEREDK